MLPQLNSIQHSFARVLDLLSPRTPIDAAIENTRGFILAQDLYADRDSPPIDVSAMDGYAVRLGDLQGTGLPLTATSAAGSPPVELMRESAIRIFTGGPIPSGCDLIVKREDAFERDGNVYVQAAAQELRYGQHIRRKGENIREGQVVLTKGTVLEGPALAAIASFGQNKVIVYPKVSVAIINTGDELVPPGQHAEPWQIRDSNGLMLEAMLNAYPWIHVTERHSVGDSQDQLVNMLNDCLTRTDAVLLTGGVSMGDFDYVPASILQAGGKIVFHKLPIRPGRPLLSAIGNNGQLICGLPGNPVSVAVTARRFAIPWLAKLGGKLPVEKCLASFDVSNPDSKKLDLVWYRLVKKENGNQVRIVESSGSGDLVSLALSDGFIEIPVGESGAGPFDFYSW